jgi:peptidyl-prolyl cis-trans isomerase A (cyclophilin A)
VLRIVALVAVACALCAGCGSSKSTTTSTAQTATTAPTTTAAAPTTTAAAPAGGKAALLDPAKLTAQAPAVYMVDFDTTKGPFTVTVHRAWAPKGADRFYNLVQNRFYDGVRFFRVVPDFVVQFGIHPDPKVAQAWQNANIKDDPVTQSNKRGTLTFATAGANTRTTQVFINLADNASLDAQGFAPFGAVTSGMATVAKLYSGYGDAPTSDQSQMASEGDAFLKKNFPKLDRIVTARVSQ